MNPFTRHPYRQGLSYLEHWRFAMGIGYRLVRSVVAFAAHAMFPFVSIPRGLDLESTADFIRERNAWIESAGGIGTDGRDAEAGAGANRDAVGLAGDTR